MNEDTSIYLDAVRFGAAMAVFLSHACGQRLTGGLLWQLGPYGTEAVDVFFVLSGFVIAYVHDTRERAPMRFVVSRFARIYSVAVPALILTFLLDAVGRISRPALYNLSWGYVWHGRGFQFLQALTFANQIWFNNISPGSDLPYWSLGFEVWYYAIFATAVFAPWRWRIPAVPLLLLFVGPKIVAMFPLWLLGVVAYYVCNRVMVPLIPALTLCFGGIAVWIGYEVYAWHFGRLMETIWPGSNSTIQDYIVGLAFFVHLIGFRFVSHIPSPALRFFKTPIRWVAGATLSLYLLHLPLLQFVKAEAPWPAASWQGRSLLYLGVPLVVFAIAEVTERRKDIWRRGFHALFTRVFVVAT